MKRFRFGDIVKGRLLTPRQFWALLRAVVS
jgi:hypothetical protein